MIFVQFVNPTAVIVVVHDHCDRSMFCNLDRLVSVQGGTHLPSVQVIKVDDHFGVPVLGLDLLDALTRLQGGKCIPVHDETAGQVNLHHGHVGALLVLAHHGNKAGTGRKMEVVRMGVPIHSGIEYKSWPGTGHVCVIGVADLGQCHSPTSGRNTQVFKIVWQLESGPIKYKSFLVNSKLITHLHRLQG